jgi:hypothetical protein
MTAEEVEEMIIDEVKPSDEPGLPSRTMIRAAYDTNLLVSAFLSHTILQDQVTSSSLPSVEFSILQQKPLEPVPPGKSLLPRIDDRDAGICEIAELGVTMILPWTAGSRRDQPVGHAPRSLGGQPTPFERDAIADR